LSKPRKNKSGRLLEKIPEAPSQTNHRPRGPFIHNEGATSSLAALNALHDPLGHYPGAALRPALDGLELPIQGAGDMGEVQFIENIPASATAQG